MGGMGSGLRSGGPVTANRLSIDARRLQRFDLLTPGTTIGGKSIRNDEEFPALNMQVGVDEFTLSVRQKMKSGGWGTKEHRFRLDRTPCNYGGSRTWFICPAYGCGRRVAILYLNKMDRFACRHCCKLAYRSQRETEMGRVGRRANDLRKKLGWPPGVVRGHGLKPKGMHWRTYNRLRAEHDVFADRILNVIDGQLGKIALQLADLQGEMNELSDL